MTNWPSWVIVSLWALGVLVFVSAVIVYVLASIAEEEKRKG